MEQWVDLCMIFKIYAQERGFEEGGHLRRLMDTRGAGGCYAGKPSGFLL